MTVSVRELKRRLSRYLKQASSGEEVTVTSRGRPLVRLVSVPPATGEEPSAAEVRRRLAMIPGIILPTGPKPRGSARPIRLRKGAKPVSETVLEERR